MLKQLHSLTFLTLLAFALALSGCPASDDDDSGTDDDDTTAADDDDSGDDDDTIGDDDDSAGPTACGTYCNRAMNNCTGENSLFGDIGQCMTACAAMPEGDFTDTSGDTAWCRAYHAEAAAGAPASHCPHASTTSDSGICGTPCDAYCDQVMANCTGTGGDSDFADRNACETACALYPSGSWNDQAGDTAQCRTYHGSFPAAGAPATHCGHAGVSGDGVCVNTR